MMGEETQAIAKDMGVHISTICRDLKAIKETDWYRLQEERLKTLDGLALANFMANLKAGNFDASKTYFKGLGILKDKVDVRVTPDIDPGATQREIEAGEERLKDLLGKKQAVEAEFEVVEDHPQGDAKEGGDTHKAPTRKEED